MKESHVLPGELVCSRCDGEGRIADTEDGEPWSFWEGLPARSDLAVRMGLVKPIDCPSCGGTGGADARGPRC